MSKLLTELPDERLAERDIRAVFFDIDGTLLGLDGNYTSAVREEILRIKSLGIKTAIASGRPHFATGFLVEELGLDDAGQFCTGAHIYQPREKSDLFLSTISQKECSLLMSSMQEQSLYCEVYTNEFYYIDQDQAQTGRFSHITATHSEHMRVVPDRVDLNKLIEEKPVIKFLSAVDNKADQAKLHALEKQFPTLHFAYAGIAAFPDWLFVSVVDQSACKKSAFDYMLNYYGLESEQVMSIGDAQSDMIFVERAGLGIAMGNGIDALKSVANYITKPVWQDGVAYALSRLIK